MPATCRADVEALLRAKKLDRTLVPVTGTSGIALAPETVTTGLTLLDQQLGGGLPIGHLSEVTGPRSSGRTSLLMAMLAATTGRGELAALVDTFDMFDVESMAAAGVRLDRLLWVRGDVSTSAFPPLTNGRRQPGADRAIARALKAMNLILQSGGMSLAALDLADAPLQALRRVPITTWLRLQKVVEGQSTAAVVVGPVPMGRSAGGVTMALTRDSGPGTRDSGGMTGARLAAPDPALRLAAGAACSGQAGRPFGEGGGLALGASGIASEVRIQRARLVPGMGAPVRLTAAALVA